MAALSNMCCKHLMKFSIFCNKRNIYPTLTTQNVSLISLKSVRNASCISSSIYSLRKCQRHSPKPLPQPHISLALPVPLSLSCSYSTDNTPDKPISITDNILKSRVSAATDEQTEQDSKEREQTDSKKEEKKKDTWYSGKNAWKFGLFSLAVGTSLMGGNLLYLWGTPLRDKDGNEMEDEFSHLPNWQAYPQRAVKEAEFFKKSIVEPSSRKLLPDTLKHPYYQPPYTLVLEMTGVLVHPDWTLSTGWRFKKRPDLDKFFEMISPPNFEVVIYTKEQGMTAFPIINGMDPHGVICYRLFRDATRYMDGQHVKDLDCLNRDLSKVIIVDCDPKAFQLHPTNGVMLNKWKGEDGDGTLKDLGNFLLAIAVNQVEDVRPVLEYYSQFDDPLAAFKENQRRLQEQEMASRTSSTQKKSQGWGFGSWRR